ncbi:Acetyltransferase (GNAT) domain-containing protein [Nitrosospira multiformis]|uniref:Acetyltransferase (GNAT) domain-containing protein n=1 Tax=Nitrosospira multiformis TaxID=1231 RepID=A0A1H8B2D5_9PROT|nr:GNAT family N-acetyltransferase [Nitrosospira multiformis]SEM77071.1 Acetyltransferase (GNAT) domain-containing protein [Nitrosospira multiformis]
MSWSIENALDAFPKYRQQWDDLNAATGDHILLDSRFVHPLLEKDRSAKQPVLLATFKSMSEPAMLLLKKTGIGSWSLFQPSQQPIGMVLFSPSANASEKVEDLLYSLPGLGLVLGITQQDPDHTFFQQRDTRSNREFIRYIQTGRIMLTKDFEYYWNDRPQDLRDNNARRRRKLERQGVECKLEELRLPGQMTEGIRNYSRMEQSGWKFRSGTAVGDQDPQGTFYRKILELFCERGEGAIYQLLFNGNPVASQICITRGGMVISLKIAYDEQFRSAAPGFLLQEEIIRHLYKNSDMRLMEFYGRVTEGWTKKWTDEIRTMFHVNFYRNVQVRSGIHFLKSILTRKKGTLLGES